jgi:predicted dehydrogenase
MIKAGVLGAGHLGKIHLRLLQQSDQYELIGFHDPNPAVAASITEEFGYHHFTQLDDYPFSFWSSSKSNFKRKACIY